MYPIRYIKIHPKRPKIRKVGMRIFCYPLVDDKMKTILGFGFGFWVLVLGFGFGFGFEKYSVTQKDKVDTKHYIWVDGWMFCLRHL
jgi:hypothetical protein